MIPFTEKYKPQSSKDLEIDPQTLEQLRLNIFSKIPTLINGPVGSGKTSAVHAIAKEHNYEILEINASDTRNREQIENIIGTASQQQSLFNKNKILLIDEIDGLSSKDRGGVQTLTKLLEHSQHAIVMTANDAYNYKLKSLRKKCKLLEFQTPTLLSILNILKAIAKKENINYDEQTLKTLARRANSDIRAAINDLQITTKNKEIKQEHLEILGDREKQQSILNALKLIFKTKDPKISLKAFDNTNIDFNEAMLWIDQNLPLEYQGEDLKKAYNILSKADVHKGRISKQQYWRLLVYQIALMTAGISLSKQKKNPNFIQYKRSSRPLKIWLAKSSLSKKTSISEKLAEKTHISIKKAKKELNYLKPAIKTLNLDLNTDEITWLNKFE